MEAMPNLTLENQTTEFLLYTAPNSAIKVEVLLSKETIWLTQERMAELFGVQRPAITKHLKHIFESNELQEDVVCSILEHTTAHGAIGGKTQTSKTKYYNLDAVISVGYRVNSAQATQFRIWATALIREYIIKGFAMDDERLKNGRYFGTSANCWSGCALYAPVSGGFISRLRTFLLSAASITTRNLKPPVCFTRMCRTNFILRLLAIR
jgi:predicted XRE-type DNA-binding protein